MGFKIQEEVTKGIGASRRTEVKDVPRDQWFGKPKKKNKKVKGVRRTDWSNHQKG